MNNIRKNYVNQHILAKGVTTCTDTWESGINNNVLIFGPSGAGKTRHYVKPNILGAHESLIVSDTKGNLYNELVPQLERRGYEVKAINFNDFKSGCGYNPLDYIRYDEENDMYNEQDIISLSCSLVPVSIKNDPYWDLAARQYLEVLIGYVFEALPKEEHTLEYVVKTLHMMGSREFDNLMAELEMLNPNGTTAIRYKSVRGIANAEKMDASIKGILSTNLDTLSFNDALALYKKPDRVNFEELGVKKTAIFLTISDTDRFTAYWQCR